MTSDRGIVWGAAAAVVVAAGAIYYFGYARHAAPVAPPAPKVQPAPATPVQTPAPQTGPTAPATPVIQHPVPAPSSAAAAAPKLPTLNGSDASIVSALLGVPGAGALAQLLIPQHVIRNIVATVDNLPRRRVAVEIRPIAPTAGRFKVLGQRGHFTLDPKNYARYAPFVDVVKSINVKALVAVYFHFYPLFQQAYEDLGYPTEYFNDRVIQVIDHLLQTPVVPGPIALVQPNVMYQYANPGLESLSAGQKTLIRMGPANEAIIKAKLREIRKLLATKPPSAGPAAVAAPPQSAG